MPATSQAQAGLFGIIAGGGTPTSTDARGLTSSQARESLRGTKVKDLPERAAEYNSQDETVGDWAQRYLEDELHRIALDAARRAIPQTPGVGTELLSAKMHEVADALCATEEAAGPLTTLPVEVTEVVNRLQDDLDFVLHWLEENGSQ